MIRTRENHTKAGVLRPVIFGINDGIVSMIALVAGLAGAALENRVVIIAGLAEMFAGAISMALGEYISLKSELELKKNSKKVEITEIEEIPETERKEIEDIYRKKGFKGELLNKVVKTITSNKKVWLDTMIAEELKLGDGYDEDPKETGFFMGLAYILASLIPLLPFFFLPLNTGLMVAIPLAIITLFFVGSAKSHFTRKTWWKSGLEMVIIGAAATIAGYYIGKAFSL